ERWVLRNRWSRGGGSRRRALRTSENSRGDYTRNRRRLLTPRTWTRWYAGWVHGERSSASSPAEGLEPRRRLRAHGAPRAAWEAHRTDAGSPRVQRGA